MKTTKHFRNFFLLLSLLALIIFSLTGCDTIQVDAKMPESEGPAAQQEFIPLILDTAAPSSDEDAIKAALAAHLGTNVGNLRIVIQHNNGTHARGGVDNGYFLAAKVNGQWQIVADGQGALNCQVIAQYNFPPSMVPECLTPPAPASDEDAIKAALAAHLGTDVSNLSVVIDQNTGTHARGGVDNGYFLAAKVNGQWQIVADGQGALNCQAIAQYGFPPTMVPECAAPPAPTSDEDAIKAALAAHLGTNVGNLRIVIQHNNGTHARGGVDNGYFLAAKVNGQWQIVADGQGALNCQVITQYNFPPSMIPECLTPPAPASDEDAIKAALAAHLGTNVSNLSVVIDQNTGTHARGGVDNGYFLAAKVNGQWQIVADGQGALNCQAIAQYGFPPTMVPECAAPPASGNSSTKMNFKTGGTYTYIQRSIKAGEQHSFTLRALAGQTMILSIASSDNDVFFAGVRGVQGGQQLLSNNSQVGYWTGTLPQTQDYKITLTTNNPDTNYFLGVEIPANIRFTPGYYSTSLKGHIEVFDADPSAAIDNHVTYLAYASAGQTLDVRLYSPNVDALSLGVYGQEDGQPYLRYQVKNSGYHGVLPLTQGYDLKSFLTDHPLITRLK